MTTHPTLDRVISEQKAAGVRSLSGNGGDVRQLASMVLDLHEAEHQHHVRYCEVAACRRADEVMNGYRGH